MARSFSFHLLGFWVVWVKFWPVNRRRRVRNRGLLRNKVPLVRPLSSRFPRRRPPGWSGFMAVGVGRVCEGVREGFLGCVCDEGGWIRGLLPRDPILSSSSPRRLAIGGDDGGWVPLGGGAEPPSRWL